MEKDKEVGSDVLYMLNRRWRGRYLKFRVMQCKKNKQRILRNFLKIFL